MQSKLASWCDGLIEAGVLAAVIIAPLFFNIHSDRVFEPDKLTLVRSIALLMAGAWLVRFVERQDWTDRSWLRWHTAHSVWRVPFVLPVFLLVVIYIVSTLFSIVPRTSWAGSYQRLQGTYTTLSYIVIFALAASTFRRREQVNRLVTTVIVTSIPISLYGLLQHYGLDPLPWGGNVQDRIAGHMGNAIFVAAYLIMAVPLTVARIIDAFTNILGDEVLSYADVIRSSIYIFALAIQLVAIYWSGSRGPMLGLLVGLFALALILLVSLRNSVTESGRFRVADLGRALALVIVVMVVSGGAIYLLFSVVSSSERAAILAGPGRSLAAFAGSIGMVAVAIFVMVALRRGWRWLWLSWLILTLIGMLWLGAFNLVPESTDLDVPAQSLSSRVAETVQDWRELPTVGRFGRLLEAERGTGRVRVLIWEGALDLIRPHEPLVYPNGERDPFNFLRPLIGYGPESMYVAYNRFYVPELATLEARNASPDRSHNETFDALIITGLSGFLVWQALYLSVFYYGFRWLGVVRSARDRNLLIAFWVAGAIIGALTITQLLGIVYIGVAIPFGSIAGLVVYLVYYALFSSTGASSDTADDPFQVDRLLLMGLVAAVVAHYVEIHFGIAIAATRVHFFVYVALMMLVGFVLPRLREGETALGEPLSRPTPRGRLRTSTASANWWGPVLTTAFALSLIVGTLFFEYLNYSQPPNAVVETIADVPSTSAIIHQAYFIHPGQGFVESPFIYLLIVLSWALGTPAYMSEMVRQGSISPAASSRRHSVQRNYRTAGIVFLAMVVVAFAQRLLPVGDSAISTTQLLGQGLTLVWSAFCLFAAVLLIRNHRLAEEVAGFLAAMGLALAIPVLFAGGALAGIVLLVGCSVILYLLWGGSWSGYVTPALVTAISSLLLGFILAYLHASQIRTAVFFGPPQEMSDIERLLYSSQRFAGFVTLYYAFVFLLLLAAPFGIARQQMAQARQTGRSLTYAVLAIVIVACLAAAAATNLRVIQADIVYKQGRPLDAQASRSANAQAWEAPIALYEKAIDLAPLEDFYYLFLGRAYLEQSAVTTDPAVQQQLLETAYERLQDAQALNPLNTDHTANLARLTTRWANLDTIDETRRTQLIELARDYYSSALSLSPQNSVIRNEYANLLATLDNNCSAAIETLEQSLEIDPYYVQTYYGLAGIYEFCASRQPQELQNDYLVKGATVLEESLETSTENAASVLLQAGQLYRQGAAYDAAIEALEEAQNVQTGRVPAYVLDFELARVYRDKGDDDRAFELASQAMESAPPENQEEIAQFLDSLEAQ